MPMTEENKKSSNQNGNKSKVNILLIVIIIFLVAIVSVFAYAFVTGTFSNQGSEENVKETIDGRGVLVTLENVEEIRKQIENPTPAGSYTVSMNSEWHFDSVTMTSNDIVVRNDESNQNTVYFDLNLTSPDLQEEGELIYSSPYMPLGSELNTITLNTSLEKGEYAAIMTYHLVDDNNEEISTVLMSVKLYIQ